MCCPIREEWDWIQTLAAAGEKEDGQGAGPRAESHAPLLYYELQTAIKSLLKHINLPLHQVRTPHTARGYGHSYSVLILLCTYITYKYLQVGTLEQHEGKQQGRYCLGFL